MIYRNLFYILVVLIVLVVVVFGPRIYKGIKLKQDKVNTYAIQNMKTKKCIRPYNAGFKDNNKVILYSLNNWECITWQFIELDKGTFLLKNLYTEKTFQPVSEPNEGLSMWQKPLGGTKEQYWEFIKNSDNSYLIRLKGTELYLTAESDEQNADIILSPLLNIESQKWNLVEQHPIV